MHWLLALVVPIVARPPPFVPQYTYDCANGRAPDIVASGISIAITGACATVTLSGRANVVQIESAARLVVTGSENRVGSAIVDVIDVRGNANYVVSSRSARGPIVHNTGTDNTIAVGKQLTIQLQ
jgi:hypothetical protein